MKSADHYLDGPGCGTAEHDDDCLCDLRMPVGPPAPARNVPQALAELRALHGDAVASLAETAAGAAAAAEYAETSNGPHRAAGSLALRKLLAHGATLDEVAETVGLSVRQVCRKLTKSDDMIPVVLRIDAALRAIPKDQRIMWSDLARELDVTRNYLAWWARTIGRDNEFVGKQPGGSNKYSKDAWAQARKLRAQGMAWREVEAHTGIPKTTLAQIASRKGWSAPPKRHSAEAWAKARAAVERGCSQAEASELSGIPRSTIGTRAKADGWVAA